MLSLVSSSRALDAAETQTLDYSAPSPGTDQTFRIAVLMINTLTTPIADNPLSRQLEFYSPETLGDIFFEHEYGAAAYIREASYGKVTLEGTVVGWIDAPEAGLSAADIVAQKDDYIGLAAPYITFDDYDIFVVHALAENGSQQTGWRYPEQRIVSSQGTTTDIGITWMINSSVFDQAPLLTSYWSSGDSVLPTTSWAHELIHSLGIFGHSNSLDCGNEILSLEGDENPQKGYGDPFSIMGEYAWATHLDPHSKQRLGWLEPAQVPEITTNGIYEIYPLALNDDQTKGLVIPLDTVFSHPQDPSEYDAFTIEYRTPMGFDRYLQRLEGSTFLSRYTSLENIDTEGVIIRLRNNSLTTTSTVILDMHPDTTFNADRGIKHPGNPGKFADAILPVNNSFTWGDIQIVPLGTTASGAMQVQVTFSGGNRIYNDWTVAPYQQTLEDPTATGNPDGDALVNLQEFAFGLDPTSAGTQPLNFTLGGEVTSPGTPMPMHLEAENGSQNFHAVFTRRKDYAAAKLLYSVDFTADLEQWTTSHTTPTRLTDDQSTQETEVVSVPFPPTVPSNNGASDEAPQFFRVSVDFEE